MLYLSFERYSWHHDWYTREQQHSGDPNQFILPIIGARFVLPVHTTLDYSCPSCSLTQEIFNGGHQQLSSSRLTGSQVEGYRCCSSDKWYQYSSSSSLYMWVWSNTYARCACATHDEPCTNFYFCNQCLSKGDG